MAKFVTKSVIHSRRRLNGFAWDPEISTLQNRLVAIALEQNCPTRPETFEVFYVKKFPGARKLAPETIPRRLRDLAILGKLARVQVRNRVFYAPVYCNNRLQNQEQGSIVNENR